MSKYILWVAFSALICTNDYQLKRMPTLNYLHALPESEERLALQQLKTRSIGWKAWWNGSPYANPLNELLGKLADGAVKYSAAANSPVIIILPLEVTPTEITVALPDGERAVYPIKETSNIRLDYGPQNQTAYEQVIGNRLSFSWRDQKFVFNLAVNDLPIRETIDIFLDNRILFREYRAGIRSHRLQTGFMYADIQQLKKKYNIVW
jgi:hypothetical protein